jgi:hypothetical protein
VKNEKRRFWYDVLIGGIKKTIMEVDDALIECVKHDDLIHGRTIMEVLDDALVGGLRKTVMELLDDALAGKVRCEDAHWVAIRSGVLPQQMLHRYACVVARSLLSLYEAEYPDDSRPRRAIMASWGYSNITPTVRNNPGYGSYILAVTDDALAAWRGTATGTKAAAAAAAAAWESARAAWGPAASTNAAAASVHATTRILHEGEAREAAFRSSCMYLRKKLEQRRWR